MSLCATPTHTRGSTPPIEFPAAASPGLSAACSPAMDSSSRFTRKVPVSLTA